MQNPNLYTIKVEDFESHSSFENSIMSESKSEELTYSHVKPKLYLVRPSQRNFLN